LTYDGNYAHGTHEISQQKVHEMFCRIEGFYLASTPIYFGPGTLFKTYVRPSRNMPCAKRFFISAPLYSLIPVHIFELIAKQTAQGNKQQSKIHGTISNMEV
jgi:hypothetical protein